MAGQHYKETGYTRAHNWEEALDRGIAANAKGRAIIDKIITNPPTSQTRLIGLAAQVGQCLAIELQAFADLQYLIINNKEMAEGEDLSQDT